MVFAEKRFAVWSKYRSIDTRARGIVVDPEEFGIVAL